MAHVVDDIKVSPAAVGEASELLTAQDQYRQKSRALDLVKDAVVALNSRGTITYLNRAAEDLYGWNAVELLGRTARTTLFARNKLTFDTAWTAVCDQGQWQGEIAHRTKYGMERLVESRWSAVHEKHSSSVMSVLVIGTQILRVDITAAGLAHEIRNPLAGIKGVADAFLQRRQLTRQEREWMEAVRHEVTKIDACMRELLDLSQSRCFNVRQCCLNELIAQVVLLTRHQVKSHNHGRQISVDFIDSTSEPLVMPVDAARIGDAVINLVLNAIESIDANGRVTVCLHRRARKQSSFEGNDEAVIEVTDTGCGIPHEIRHRIFEPLFTTKREGTGLGLAAVRRTAAAYHGRISFQSRLGRGSKFILALPLRTSQDNFLENSK